MAAPPAPKIGRIAAIGGGAAMGTVGGAAHGAMNAQPGESTTDAMRRGAKSGAMLGAAGGVGYRHIGNKMLKARHARQMAKLSASDDNAPIDAVSNLGLEGPAPGYRTFAGPNPPKNHITGGLQKLEDIGLETPSSRPAHQIPSDGILSLDEDTSEYV